MTMEKFHYTSRAGDEIVLPWSKNWPVGVMEDAEDVPDEKKMKFVMKALLGDDYEKVRRLEYEELTELLEAWMPKKSEDGDDSADSQDITLGESPAS